MRRHPAATPSTTSGRPHLKPRRSRKVIPMTNTSHPAPSRRRRRRRLAAAGLALAGLLGALFTAAAAAQASQPTHPAATTGQTIHLVAHEKQRKFFNNGGFGDLEIF